MAGAYIAGPEMRVNTTAGTSIYDQSVTALSDGGWLVTWPGSQGSWPNSTAPQIFQLRYTSSGLASGGAIMVNTPTASWHSAPSVTALVDGGWLVTWVSEIQDGSWYDIYQQRYTSAGATLGSETRVNTYTDDGQTKPSVTGLADGGWLVTWMSTSQDGEGKGVYQQRYASSGTPLGGEALVNTTTASDQSRPSVTTLADGGWLVIWESSYINGAESDIYQQRYSSAGLAIGGETLVNTTTADWQFYASVTGLVDGGWVVTWTSETSGRGIYQQRYTASGLAIGGETLVNTTTLDFHNNSSVTALQDGGWLVTWHASDSGSYSDVYQQRYNSAGLAAGGETRVNTYTADQQSEPVVIGLTGGGWLVTWSSTGVGGIYGVYQKMYRPIDDFIIVPATTDYSGQALTDKHGLVFVNSDPATATFDAGQFGPGLINDASWINGNASANAIVVNVGSALSFSAAGWSFADWSTGVDTITINGSGSNDSIVGSSQPDAIIGGIGDDTLAGGAGSDTLAGGDGNDVVNYALDSVSGGGFGVYVRLSDGVAVDGFGAFDSLLSIEVVYGTDRPISILPAWPAWSDFIIGTGANEIFHGLGGNDYLDMGAGVDLAYGGTGNDYLFGGADDDYLFGDAGLDYIDGGNGNDAIAGGTDADNLMGGTGADTIWGEAGSDVIVTGTGSDVVYSGTGADFIYDPAVENYTAGDFDTFADLSEEDYIVLPLALQGLTGIIDYNGGALIYSVFTGGNWYGFVTGQSAAFTQVHMIFE